MLRDILCDKFQMLPFNESRSIWTYSYWSLTSVDMESSKIYSGQVLCINVNILVMKIQIRIPYSYKRNHRSTDWNVIIFFYSVLFVMGNMRKEILLCGISVVFSRSPSFIKGDVNMETLGADAIGAFYCWNVAEAHLWLALKWLIGSDKINDY